MQWKLNGIWIAVACLIGTSNLLSNPRSYEDFQLTDEEESDLVFDEDAAFNERFVVDSESSGVSRSQMKSAGSACHAAPLMGDPTCGGWGVFLTADALVWKLKNDGFAYTIKNDEPATNSLFPYPNRNAEVKHLDFDWSWGYRIGAGYHCFSKKWDLELQGTYYQQETHARTKADGCQELFATWMAPTSLQGNRFSPYSVCLEAKAKQRIYYSVLDLDLGRHCQISRFFSLRPHGGVRSAWIDQKVHVHYINFPGVQSNPASGWEQVKVGLKNDFWGWGLRAGLDSAWILWKSWSIFCNAACSLLWGNYGLSNKEVDFPKQKPPILNAHFKNSYHTLRSNFECALGVRWDWLFAKDRYHFAFSLGWEEIIWFNQNQFNHLNNAVNVVQSFKEHGDLGLSGFTLDVRFDF